MKIMFITKSAIYSKAQSGGVQCSVRNYQLLEKIVGKGNIYVCMLTNKKDESGKKSMRSFYYPDNNLNNYRNYLFMRNGYNKKTERKMASYINQARPEIIFFDGSPFGGLVKKIRINCKVMVFYHNIEWYYVWDHVLHNSPICLVRLMSTYYNERVASRRADLRICLNNRDAMALEKKYKVKCDYYLPITFEDQCKDLDFSHVSITDSSYLLFVGSNFLANYQGIKWFVENVMEKIQIHLKIVGKNTEQWRDELSRENVEIIGTVDDLRPYYLNAAALVMPIFMGAGMKVKTAEAMMYGKAIFGTKEAFEGYEIQGIKNLFICNTREEFTDSVNQYLATAGNQLFYSEIRSLFLRKYETGAVEDSFRRLLEAEDGENER